MKTKHVLLRCRAKTILLLLSTATLLAAAPAARAESASDLMEQGIYSEETKGDLDSAVQLYKRVIAQARTDQALAAQAQYHLGLCYYKQQNYTDANTAFETLVKDYPDQKDMVALARKYLAANYSTALDHYEMLGKHFNDIKGYERYAEMSKYLNEIGKSQAVEDYIQLMAWGTPKQVLEKYEGYKRLTDMQGVMPNLNFGGMPPAEVQRNIACFVKHVMPELRSWPSAMLEEPKELALSAV